MWIYLIYNNYSALIIKQKSILGNNYSVLFVLDGYFLIWNTFFFRPPLLLTHSRCHLSFYHTLLNMTISGCHFYMLTKVKATWQNNWSYIQFCSYTKHNIFAIITKIGFAYSTPLPLNHEGFLFVTFSFIIVLWISCKNIDKIIHCRDPSFGGAMYFCHHCEVNIWSLFLFVATAIPVLLAAISILWNTLPPCASSSSNTFCMIVLSFSCNLVSHHILHFSGAFEQVTSVRVFSQPMPSPPVSNSASAFACAT